MNRFLKLFLSNRQLSQHRRISCYYSSLSFKTLVHRHLSLKGFCTDSVPQFRPRIGFAESKRAATIKMSTIDKSLFVFPIDQPVVALVCQHAFDCLTDKEKLYAHHLSQASWKGGLIVLFQTSPESPLIFALFLKLCRAQSIAELKNLAIEKCNFTQDNFQAMLIYFSGILTNMGNYKSFGDSKFIPGVEKEKLEKLIKASEAYKKDEKTMEFLWTNCSEAIFSIDENNKQLGLGKNGITTYFSSNCTQEDADLIKKFLTSKNLDAYNTRLFKVTNENDDVYEIRLASSLGDDETEEQSLMSSHDFEGKKITISRGDYSELMKLIVQDIKQATSHASNETQIKMLEKYIQSFRTGSVKAHEDGSRYWIHDKGPIVETYIGFIESYRDPVGQRAEFEGFVAMVNKEMTAKFAQLVEKAEEFLPTLPWPQAFEKDKFLRPDFTSLDVMTFSGSGIPAGINIPNYESIRQIDGFKNVSLGNVIPASYKEVHTLFLSDEDQVLLHKYRISAFELQVGLHELLGHGSGKLFLRRQDGTFNFDTATVLDPITGEKIKSWYEHGDTYNSVFTSTGSAYEECRAESVGLYLSLNTEILKIFGFEGEEAETIIYINWLSLLLSALRSLEMYQPDKKLWGQAHSQARYVIMQVLLEAGQGLVTLKPTTGSDGKPDLLLSLDRKKIATVGKEAIGIFLKKLQIYKSTADVKQASAMFLSYSAVVEDSEIPFLKYRDIVVARRQPRKMFVQANSIANDGKVSLKNYESTHEGLIQSWIERFSNIDVETILIDLWKKDKHHFVN